MSEYVEGGAGAHEDRIELLKVFLEQVDQTFPVPLSKKHDLHEFAAKLLQNATICAEVENGRIISAVAGYTERLVENMAYISIVATVPEARGRGLAVKLIREFIGICVSKQIPAIHLYAVPENTAAVRMYRKMGFVNLEIPNEPRPDDLHMVFIIRLPDLGGDR